MAHKDSPSLPVQAALLAATLIVVYGAAAALLSLEHKSPLGAGNHHGSTSSSSRSQPAPFFIHPLDYSASVRQCLPSGRECTQERYYVATSKRGAR